MKKTIEQAKREQRLRIKKLKNEKHREEEGQIKSLKITCSELQSFVKDTRYKGYKYLLESLLNSLESARKGLLHSAKTGDEYTRKGIELDAKAELLKNIIDMPESFFEKLREVEKNGNV